MISYCGETRSRKLRARLAARGFRLLVQRGRVGKAAVDLWPGWALDNAAFADFKAGRAFDEPAFLGDIAAVTLMAPGRRPDFVVLPDVVCGGLNSLRLSTSWLDRLGSLGLRLALVVQNGMAPTDLPWADPRWSVLFVGGDKAWKLATMGQWAREAHAHGRTCHVGRIGSALRYRAALHDGVDSIDSSLPLFAERNLAPLLAEMASPQGRLPL